MIATLLGTIALLCYCMAAHPTSARAPHGWYVNGVRPSGDFELREVVGRPEDDLSDARARVDGDAQSMRGRLYCTGGSTPRQDGLSVWCQR